MTAQLRDVNTKLYSFIDAQGHYCEVWDCDDDDERDDCIDEDE